MGVDSLLKKYRQPCPVDPFPPVVPDSGPVPSDRTDDSCARADSSGSMPSRVEITLGRSASVDVSVLPVSIADQIITLFRSINPVWRRRRFYQGATPPAKYLEAYHIDDDGRLCVPRAAVRRLIDLFQSHRCAVSIVDRTTSFPVRMDVVSDAARSHATTVDQLCRKRFYMVRIAGAGGSDLYSLPAAIVAYRSERTLVVVKTRAQLYQWRDALVRHTTLTTDRVGLVGDRNADLDADVIVGIDRSLYAVIDQLRVGHVVVDRADVANPKIFFRIVWPLATRYVTGVARMDRTDGLQPFVEAFCGPVAHTAAAADIQMPSVSISAAPAGVYEGDDYHRLLVAVCENTDRNIKITTDIVAAAADGKTVVVVSPRKDHLQVLADMVRAQYRDAEIIDGRTGTEKKRQVEDGFVSGRLPIIFTTTKTLQDIQTNGTAAVVIVAAPFKYQGTAASIVATVRPGGQIIEYHDEHDFFIHSLDRRLSLYERLGLHTPVK